MREVTWQLADWQPKVFCYYSWFYDFEPRSVLWYSYVVLPW